jgi:hypothetical protein
MGCIGFWWGYHHQRYIHTYTSIYFASTTWSYYSRSCSSAYPSCKFTLKLRCIIFRQWRHVHSCFTQKQWIGSKGKKHRAGWIRTAGQTRFVMAATTSSGLRFGRSSTSWKVYQIYFPTDPESPLYLFRVNRILRFTTESFSTHGATSHYFGPMGLVSSWVQFGRVLGLGYDPNTLVVVLPLPYNP